MPGRGEICSFTFLIYELQANYYRFVVKKKPVKRGITAKVVFIIFNLKPCST
jgi:hypothetical protein